MSTVVAIGLALTQLADAAAGAEYTEAVYMESDPTYENADVADHDPNEHIKTELETSEHPPANEDEVMQEINHEYEEAHHDECQWYEEGTQCQPEAWYCEGGCNIPECHENERQHCAGKHDEETGHWVTSGCKCISIECDEGMHSVENWVQVSEHEWAPEFYCVSAVAAPVLESKPQPDQSNGWTGCQDAYADTFNHDAEDGSFWTENHSQEHCDHEMHPHGCWHCEKVGPCEFGHHFWDMEGYHVCPAATNELNCENDGEKSVEWHPVGEFHEWKPSVFCGETTGYWAENEENEDFYCPSTNHIRSHWNHEKQTNEITCVKNNEIHCENPNAELQDSWDHEAQEHRTICVDRHPSMVRDNPAEFVMDEKDVYEECAFSTCFGFLMPCLNDDTCAEALMDEERTMKCVESGGNDCADGTVELIHCVVDCAEAGGPAAVEGAAEGMEEAAEHPEEAQGDDGEHGPPPCVMDCPGLFHVDHDNADALCEYIDHTKANEAWCLEDCDATTLEMIDTFRAMDCKDHHGEGEEELEHLEHEYETTGEMPQELEEHHHEEHHYAEENYYEQHHGEEHYPKEHHGEEHHNEEHHGKEHHGEEHHYEEHHNEEHHGEEHHNEEPHYEEHHGEEHHNEKHHYEEHHGEEHHNEEHHGEEHHHGKEHHNEEHHHGEEHHGNHHEGNHHEGNHHGPPACVMDCPGLFDVDHDSADALCDFIDHTQANAAWCFEDCDEMTILMIQEFRAMDCQDHHGQGEEELTHLEHELETTGEMPQELKPVH